MRYHTSTLRSAPSIHPGVVALVALLGGCTFFTDEDPDRGELTISVRAETVTRESNNKQFAKFGHTLNAKYDVAVHMVSYRSIDAAGEPIVSTGTIVIPDMPEGSGRIPLLSYQHGTVVKRTSVPSLFAQERAVAIGFASLGYVAVIPDYVGLGPVPEDHPFVHASSEATSVVDLLRASYRLARRNGVLLGSKVFLVGASQGGHASLAAQRDLELRHGDEFTVAAVAPIAGPYDLSQTMVELMLDRSKPHPNPYQLPYLLTAYNRVYRFFPTDAELFEAPYDKTLPPLFDGKHAYDEISAVMPAAPVDVMNASFLAAFRADSDHPLRVALRENDLVGRATERDPWTPRAPVRFFHCKGDLTIPYDNAQIAYDNFSAAGAKVELMEPPGAAGADHDDCLLPGLFAAKDWFETLR